MKGLKVVLNIISTVLVIAAAALAIALVGVRVVGLTPYTVLSASMEPTYMTGSIVYVKKVNTQDLKIGDPITFMLSEKAVATHRIYDIVYGGEDSTQVNYVTKGDANENIDANPVNSNNVIGKPVFTIPYLGYVADFIQNKPGRYLAIAACALILLFAFLPDIFGDKSKGKSKGKKKENAE